MALSAKVKKGDAYRSAENTADLYLAYRRHVTPEVISVGASTLMTTMEMSGVSFETTDISELNDLQTKLNLMWQNLADERLAVWVHMVRAREHDYPDGEFTSAFARDLNAKYRERMVGEQLFRNRWFLTLLWNPAIDSVAKASHFFGKLGKARKEGVEADPLALKALEEKRAIALALLARYEPRTLSLYEHNGLIFSQPMEFLQLIGSLDELRMPLVDGPISGAVMLNRPLFGREAVEIRGPSASRYGGILGIKEYPATTRPGMLNAILSAPFESVLTQSFGFISKAAARDRLTRKQNQMISTADRAFSQVEELDHALDDLESNRFVLGEYHLNLAVYADTPRALLDSMSIARRLLTDGGINPAREDLALEAAYWSQFPGNFKFRPRSGAISSRNFAALAGFHSFPSGEPTNIWGPAVALLKTTSGCPFHFNFHHGDLGSTFICGPSGSGKTVIQNFMLAQLEKLDATMVFFDKDRGADIFVRACGGSYLPLKNGRATGCAPLKVLDLEDGGDQAFAIAWLSKLVERADRPFSVAEQRQIDEAVQHLARLPVPLRTIASLRDFFDYRDPEGIGARLERWRGDGALGWVFDCPEDTIALDAKLMGFDMTDFLDNAEIRTPLMMYLFHRIERLIDGRRIVIDIDEFWKPLGDAYFRELMRNKLKTIRKQNGLLVFGTQEPGDAIESEIGRTVISQCPTQIFMPNPRADYRDYVDGFKCTRREFELIKKVLSPESRRFLIKQGHNSAVAELNLNGFRDELTILSGRTEAVNRLDQLRAEVGDDPAAWLPRLLGGS
jgi:type IV secretion system protein VirB4